MSSPPLLEALMVALAAVVALPFHPFAVLRSAPLRNAWLAALALLPLAWGAQRVLPGGAALQLSGACLLVLMFGWPLAVWTLLPVAVAGAWLAGTPIWPRALELAAWHGVLPATFALGLGMLTRRWLPPHPFVFILGRGFLATAVAVMGAGALATWWRPRPVGADLGALLVGHWLMAWGDAFLTGMAAAIFVAFRPEWLLTWSDRRYLPKDGPPRG